MRKVLNGGSVRRQDSEDKAVDVLSIAFSGLSPSDPPSAGDDAVMNVKVAPKDPYELDDALLYQDGDGGNVINFQVQSVGAPTTYNLMVV